MASLTSFAETQNKTNCKVCEHPDRKEIEEGLDSGLRYTLIRAWLASEGKPLFSESTLTRHIRDHRES